MGRALRGQPGGIASLLALPREQWQALEVDLARGGLFLCDLGSDRLSWRLLAGIVRHSPRDSALMRVTFGAEVAWSSTEHLLAALVDLTQYLVWFKTEDARSGRNRPKPIHRPGMDEAHGDVSLGSGGMVIDPNDTRTPAEQVRARYEALAAEQSAREEAVTDGV